MSNVFISYSTVDKTFAQSLASDLKSVGTAVWIDFLEIKDRDSIFQRINEALELNDLFVFIMSPESISSYWVQKELDAAFAKKAQIIPILIKSCSIPPLLSGIKTVDFREDYYRALFELLKRIKASVQGDQRGTGLNLGVSFGERLGSKS